MVRAKGAERNGQGVIRDHLRDLRWEDETPRHGLLPLNESTFLSTRKRAILYDCNEEEEQKKKEKEKEKKEEEEEEEEEEERMENACNSDYSFLELAVTSCKQLEVEWLLMKRQQGKEKKVGDW
ncbi:hypothetical protein HZH68_013469 [Vespula germanica]|uniref:Uncharacterized protein n=1 Tax=Vespula germanica TaxID=30212 RepID=A0A834JFS3_VESGE|nr:hypothetical protein HZH68_013469 [Vespula germanica]